MITSTSIIPNDDSIPRQTEGVEVMNSIFFPSRRPSILEITVQASFLPWQIWRPRTSRYTTVALFSKGSCFAIAYRIIVGPGLKFRHFMSSRSALEVEISVRVGPADQGDIVYFVDEKSYIQVKELDPGAQIEYPEWGEALGQKDERARDLS